MALFQLFRLQRDALLASSFPLPVLADPGFPTFTGGGVASAERQRGDVGISNGNFLRGILRDEAHH